MNGLAMSLPLLLVPAVQAQVDLVSLTDYEVLAAFEEASDLAIDARERLYVVDRGREVVVQLDLDGRELARLGGPGGGDGAFDEPQAIDPGAGLTWLVADAGNGRLQRFSQTLLYMESLAVPRATQFEPGTRNRLESRDEGLQNGWPVAVAQSPTGEIFAIEAHQGVVLKWDKSRRLERAIGAYGLGEGALVEPVALAVDKNLLYVADRGLGTVIVYDLFGGYVRTLARGRAEAVHAIVLEANRLWVVLPTKVHVFGTAGSHLFELVVRSDLELVAVVPYNDFVFSPYTDAAFTRIQRRSAGRKIKIALCDWWTEIHSILGSRHAGGGCFYRDFG